MSKFLNISTDNTLGGNSPSDVTVSSQKAIKEYVDSHGGGGGSVTVDGKSITRNSSQEIQTVGVINSRDTSTAIKTWTGTKNQYDAILSKDANTLYNITDDTDVSLTILEALYPVGSIYITTANTCPLSALISGSTWTLRSSGVVTSVDSNVPVKGDGKGIGFKGASYRCSLKIVSTYGFAETSSLDSNIGSSAASAGSGVETGKVLGLDPDATKSHVVGTVSSTSLSVNIFERTA